MAPRQYDIPFATDDAHRFLPWLIGMMVGMAALMLCLVTSINGWIVTSHGSYSNNFTVDVPAISDERDAKILKIRDALRRMPGVTAVDQIGEEALRAQLKPWFGSGDVAQDLPLPTVLEVTTDGKPGDADYYIQAQKTLSAIVPGTEVDAHERWVASFADFTSAVQAIVGGLAVMIIGVMSAMIGFAARASLKMHKRTVHLLHSIGAEDNYIAKQFQREAFLLAVRGGLAGCVIACVVYWIAGNYIASLHSAIIPSLALGLPHAGLLLLMPLGCGGVAWLATRVTMLRQLERVL